MPSKLRISWTFGFIGTLVLAMNVLDRYSPHPEPRPDPVLLSIYCLLALALAAATARDIWALKVRTFPLWFDLLGYAVGLGGIAVFIFLKETSHATLSMDYVALPVIVYMFPVVVAALVTEKKKRVRVYFGARTLVFTNDRPAL